MSGPTEPSDGRAVNANHAPSDEKAADSPTTLTPDTMARVRAAVATGVAVGLTVGVTAGVGSAVAVGVGVRVVPAGSDGSVVAGGEAVAGGSLGRTVGATVGTGVALGSAVGRARTTTESSPCASVPTTTAWLRTGDCEIDFGRTVICTAFDLLSATGAQSGWRSAGQTWLTGVTL